MLRILLALLALSLFSAPAYAVVPVFVITKDKSTLKFFAIQNSAPLEGQFTDFNADITFDPDQLDKSSITAEVNTGSITSANEDVEKNVKLPEWLSTKAFPKATFKTIKLSRMPSSDNYYAQGDLTLRGKTVPVEMEFQLKTFGDTDIAEGYFTVHRKDFGVGQGQWAKDDVIKDEVRVEFRIVAEKNGTK